MRILILPDIHGRDFWERPCLLFQEDFDKIIFLGDYLDPYAYEGVTENESIQVFKEIIDFANSFKGKVVLLYGNHDLPYISQHFLDNACGGRFINSKKDEIANLFNENKGLFKLSHEEVINGKKYLFTHAGLLPSWQKRHEDILPQVDETTINKLIDSKEGINALCDISSLRWGPCESGSIVWADVHEHTKYDRIDGVYQIFGHTQQETLPIIEPNFACLDCRKAFVLNENGSIDAFDSLLEYYSESGETIIEDGEKLANGEIKQNDGSDFPSWFKEYGRHFGEKYKLPFSNIEATLVGMSYTDEDYYYVLKDDNGKRYFESCVGRIDPIKNGGR